MKSEELNVKLRDLLQKLISDGYLKYDLCSITLGSSRMDQISRFLEGRDLGVKPLNKLFENIGFELHLVPIPKNSEDELEYIKEISEESINTIMWLLGDWLENSTLLKEAKNSQKGIIDKVSKEIIEELKKIN